MLGSALSALSDRLDSKFLTAYWLPAFVGVLGCFAILTVLVGPPQMDVWVSDLDSVEQTLAVLIVVLSITMAAFVLRAISRPISEIFAGTALPRSVAAWSTRAQVRVKNRTAQAVGVPADAPRTVSSDQLAADWLNRVYPRDDAETQPTLFGNVLATAVEYPRLVYTMEGLLWWPRLAPLVPGAFQEMLGGAQAPMMALLNLSVVFTALALGGPVALVLIGGHGTAAVVTLVGGLVLSRLCYRAAVSQAGEVGSLLRVGFDLYRHEILRQMDLEIPGDLAAERALWQKLTAEMLGMPPVERPSSDAPDAPVSIENASPSSSNAAS